MIVRLLTSDEDRREAFSALVSHFIFDLARVAVHRATMNDVAKFAEPDLHQIFHVFPMQSIASFSGRLADVGAGAVEAVETRHAG